MLWWAATAALLGEIEAGGDGDDASGAGGAHQAAPFDAFWNVGGGWGEQPGAVGAEGTCPPRDYGLEKFNTSLAELGILPQNYTNVGENCCLLGCHAWNDNLPYIDPAAWKQGKLVPVNGGIPQLVNMTEHLASVRAGVSRFIPSASWSGNAVIDFEAWRPQWVWDGEHDPPRMNRYHNLSLQLVQQQHPDWVLQRQLAKAQEQFDDAAVDLLAQTLLAARHVRPAARWGFYAYPGGCVQMAKPRDMEKLRNGAPCQSLQDKLRPIWEASTGFFPSIYLPKDAGHGWPNSSALAAYIQSNIEEALRARSLVGKTRQEAPVYVYIWPLYLNGSVFLSVEDLEHSLQIPYAACADGVVIWGDRNSANDARFWRYTREVFAPALSRVRAVKRQCKADDDEGSLSFRSVRDPSFRSTPPELLNELVTQMHPQRPGNVALFLQPDNRTAVYFDRYLSGKTAAVLYTVSSDGRSFSSPVDQPVSGVAFPLDPPGGEPVRRWDGTKWVVVTKRIFQVPQVRPAGQWANLMFQMYPLGLRSAHAEWNESTARYDWPLASLTTVTTTVDGGICRPAIRLRSGRLFHIGGDGASDASVGGGIVGAFSDDNGLHWKYSTTNATIPAFGRDSGPNGRCGRVACGGGDEPMSVELSNGTIWTLIRSPGGGWQSADTSTLWQVSSDDAGKTFRGVPTPTRLVTHDSPALLLDLKRARKWMARAGISPELSVDPLLLVWTNARQGPGRKVPEGSRMLLHAALSFDEGTTFLGHREVMRDNLAKESISASGKITDDYGVGYPHGIEQADGSVLIEAGQGIGRWGFVRLDPAWLLETTQVANFSKGGASSWNNSRSFTGNFVSSCAWDEIIAIPPATPPGPPAPLPPLPKESIGGGWLIDCDHCSSSLGSAFWYAFNSTVVHPIRGCNHSLPSCCSGGRCGIQHFSSCRYEYPHYWRVLTQSQLTKHFQIGANFSCSMLQPTFSPANASDVKQHSVKPSCAPFDGVSVRPVRIQRDALSETGHHNPSGTALCVELSTGKRQATASWNFPSGRVGLLRFTMAIEHAAGRFGGAVLALSDHYAPPWTSRLEPSVSLFALPLYNGSAELGESGISLPQGQWFDVSIKWTIADDGQTGQMRWEILGLTNGVSQLLRPQGLPSTNSSNEGRASYWSLQSFGAGGVCVGSIVASVGAHGQL